MREHLAIWRSGDLALEHQSGAVAARRPHRHFAPGFTLTEMMVAVAVLLAVLIATSKIFSTASQVTGIGQAASSVLTEAAVIEQQLRKDISRLSYDGIFAIRCVAVRNDINQHPAVPNGTITAPLLNPNLPPKAFIRSDQLLFFADGVHNMQTFRLNSGSNHKGQGTVARVYWGHGFQIPEGRGVQPGGSGGYLAQDPVSPAGAAPAVVTIAPNPRWYQAGLSSQQGLFPWRYGAVQVANNFFNVLIDNLNDPGTNDFNVYAMSSPSSIPGTQPIAPQWLLARQAVALADDYTGNRYPEDERLRSDGCSVYLQQNQTAKSIFLIHPQMPGSPRWLSREVRNGRVDGAATLLDDIYRLIRNRIDTPATSVLMPWTDVAANELTQRRRISDVLLYYPRAERKAPSMHRIDQALTNHVIAGGCSSVMIDWTYEPGVGEVRTATGQIACAPGVDLADPADDVQLRGFAGSASGFVPCIAPAGTLPVQATPYKRLEQLWFGMPQLDDPPYTFEEYPDPERGTVPYNSQFASGLWATTIWPGDIDGMPQVPYTTTNGEPLMCYYEALFGYNQTQPLHPNGNPWNPLWIAPGSYVPTPASYTPWPSAIRVTVTLHDPLNRLEAGREFQFVVELPRRR